MKCKCRQKWFIQNLNNYIFLSIWFSVIFFSTSSVLQYIKLVRKFLMLKWVRNSPNKFHFMLSTTKLIPLVCISESLHGLNQNLFKLCVYSEFVRNVRGWWNTLYQGTLFPDLIKGIKSFIAKFADFFINLLLIRLLIYWCLRY